MNAELFKNQGYCIVKNAVTSELRDFITQYALFDEMQNFSTELDLGLPTVQVPNAHSRYADPAMETMLIHLQDIMEKNTGLKLHPTYSFYRVYRNGDELKIHKDRPSCEISATMCFNFNYDSKKYMWPIFVNGNEVSLHPGDMVIYRGCDLTHWRNKFEYDEDVWHVQGFFHYVDANGPYQDWKFDRRNTIGQPWLGLQKSYIKYLK